LHVVFAIDRAGLVGADGATHHGVLDICYLRSVQNMVLMAPKDEQELRDMLYSAVFSFTSGPVAFRFPRGESLGKPVLPMQEIPLGKGEIVRPGADIAILALGTMVNEALKAAENLQNEGISLEVINPRFVKPLDEDLLFITFERFEHVITIEDGQAIGGFGSAVAEFMVNKQITNKNLHIMGIPDKFIHHATQAELLNELGLDADGIVNQVKKTVFQKTELY
jgi:1-deoxy-D-xylulose-5-phosphate synthase